MQIRKLCKKYENAVIALAVIGCMALFVGLRFDYYYQANDDVYIKNILSGVYTGTPESHNIQMHYPLSLLLSLVYRLAPALPIYGLFLCLCHYGSCFLIILRSLKGIKSRSARILTALAEGMFATGLLLAELVFMQYTVTAAMLAGAAVFRFYTADAGVRPGEYIKANIGNVLLVILAYLVRSEMLLLLLPLICVAGFFRWMSEKPVFTKANAVKYLSVFGLILAGLGISQGIHMLAYGSGGWPVFNEFFDERTQLYDYQFIPSYEENKAFYKGLGLKESEQALLVNYNFGMDAAIDSRVLRETAEYAKGLKASQLSFGERFKTAFWDYRYKTFHADYPWNAAMLAVYALLFLLAWKNGDKSYFWKIPCVLFVRSGLWMYIMMGSRYPDRITHSLYFMELALLGALLWEQCGREKKKWGLLSFAALTALFLGMAGTGALSYGLEKVGEESVRRDYANKEILALDAYCRKNVENFYLVDVYSAVSCSDFEMSSDAVEYSEKAFDRVDNSVSNYDLMGGWVCKSPLWDKKLRRFGLAGDEAENVSPVELGMIDNENVYVIIKTDKNMDWLTEYYREIRGKKVRAEKEDSISVDGKTVYNVYKIEVSE